MNLDFLPSHAGTFWWKHYSSVFCPYNCFVLTFCIFSTAWKLSKCGVFSGPYFSVFGLKTEIYYSVLFTYIHSDQNYENIAWASTYRTKLKTIYLLQKRVPRVIFNKNNTTHSRPLLGSLNNLNVYQTNLFQHLRFLYKFNNNKSPIIFNDLIKKSIHKYPTKLTKKQF